jgi:methionyl-tRNA synthetase
MLRKYAGGEIPGTREDGPGDAELVEMAEGLLERVRAQMEKLQFSVALEDIFAFVRRCNKYVEENAPWKLAKKPEKKARLGAVLYNLAESLRLITILIAPFMPAKAEKMWSQLGLDDFEKITFEQAQEWGMLPVGTKTRPGEVLFPKVKT